MKPKLPNHAWIFTVWLCSAFSPGCNRQTPPSKSILTVYAASSLTEAFQTIEERFEAEQPDLDVQLVFAGSQVLRLQIEQGAKADVFASANLQHLQSLADIGLVSGGSIFAYNELAVIVPKNNPASIQSFSDLPSATRIVFANENVPVGLYTQEVLKRATQRYGKEFVSRVVGQVVSEESNVRLVRAKVELGEADAAVVYRTDAMSTNRAVFIPIPTEINIRASYPIAQVMTSTKSNDARQFISFVLSQKGRQIFEKHGFITKLP